MLQAGGEQVVQDPGGAGQEICSSYWFVSCLLSWIVVCSNGLSVSCSLADMRIVSDGSSGSLTLRQREILFPMYLSFVVRQT